MAFRHLWLGPYLEAEITRLREEMVKLQKERDDARHDRDVANIKYAGLLEDNERLKKQYTNQPETPDLLQSPEEAKLATEVGGLSWLTHPLSGETESSWEKYNRERYDELLKEAKKKKFIITPQEAAALATAKVAADEAGPLPEVTTVSETSGA